MVERPKDETGRRRNRNEKYGSSKMSLKNSSAKKKHSRPFWTKDFAQRGATTFNKVIKMSKQSFSTKTFFYSSNKKSSKFYNVTDFSSLFVRLFTGKKLKAGGKVENSCFVILQNVRDLNHRDRSIHIERACHCMHAIMARH